MIEFLTITRFSAGYQYRKEKKRTTVFCSSMQYYDFKKYRRRYLAHLCNNYDKKEKEKKNGRHNFAHLCSNLDVKRTIEHRKAID